MQKTFEYETDPYKIEHYDKYLKQKSKEVGLTVDEFVHVSQALKEEAKTGEPTLRLYILKGLTDSKSDLFEQVKTHFSWSDKIITLVPDRFLSFGPTEEKRFLEALSNLKIQLLAAQVSEIEYEEQFGKLIKSLRTGLDHYFVGTPLQLRRLLISVIHASFLTTRRPEFYTGAIGKFFDLIVRDPLTSGHFHGISGYQLPGVLEELKSAVAAFDELATVHDEPMAKDTVDEWYKGNRHVRVR